LALSLCGGLRAGVYCDDDALTSKPFGSIAYEIRVLHRLRVSARSCRAGSQNGLNIVEVSQTAANGERNIDRVGNALHHVPQQCCGDPQMR
jgi:hypothetical protein